MDKIAPMRATFVNHECQQSENFFHKDVTLLMETLLEMTTLHQSTGVIIISAALLSQEFIRIVKYECRLFQQ